MNDLVAEKAHNVFGNHVIISSYIGINDIATDKTYVFNSDNSPVLSAFSPKWGPSYGPGGNRDSQDCGVLSTFTLPVINNIPELGDWGEFACEIGTYSSICE